MHRLYLLNSPSQPILNKSMTLKRKIVTCLALFLSNGFILSCASTPQADSHETADLANRLSALEAKFAALSEQIKPTPSETPTAPPSQASAMDPLAGLKEDPAVQLYRKAIALLKSEKNPEAAHAFSKFLEKYPDHPFAGSAQFYVGEAYMRQKLFPLALREFERVLTSFDRSTYIAQTLSRMAEAETELNQIENATQHRRLLSSLFPQSPAAKLPVPTPPIKPTSQLKLDAPPSIETVRPTQLQREDLQ